MSVKSVIVLGPFFCPLQDRIRKLPVCHHGFASRVCINNREFQNSSFFCVKEKIGLK